MALRSSTLTVFRTPEFCAINESIDHSTPAADEKRQRRILLRSPVAPSETRRTAGKSGRSQTDRAHDVGT
jgi:hypothetical protein